MFELEDRLVGNRVIVAYLIHILFARTDANKDYTFVPKISKIRCHDLLIDGVMQVIIIKPGKLLQINSNKILIKFRRHQVD